MPICPSGHTTSQTDFCDTCGLPVEPPPAASAPPAPAAEAAASLTCPSCGIPNVADALFCEACGYDFTTGAMPPSAPAGEAQPSTLPDAAPDAASVADPGAESPNAASPSESRGPDPASRQTADAAHEAPPAPLRRPSVDWVAELWIDPDWYAAQGSSDPMPSPGLPDIVPLVKESNLIGRVSHSRGVFPDVDCELDTGCSRRHAMLSTDGSRWWIEDLDSANGTFVGSAAGPLPAMPLPQGRVELSPGQRIYVGAWTRIVVREATEDEREAFGA